VRVRASALMTISRPLLQLRLGPTNQALQHKYNGKDFCIASITGCKNANSKMRNYCTFESATTYIEKRVRKLNILHMVQKHREQ
jgi:hypothetical protein